MRERHGVFRAVAQVFFVALRLLFPLEVRVVRLLALDPTQDLHVLLCDAHQLALAELFVEALAVRYRRAHVLFIQELRVSGQDAHTRCVREAAEKNMRDREKRESTCEGESAAQRKQGPTAVRNVLVYARHNVGHFVEQQVVFALDLAVSLLIHLLFFEVLLQMNVPGSP